METKEIRILHVNDFHGYAIGYKPLGSDKMLGGISYLAWKADVLRNEKPTVFLAAGDMIQGNNWANIFHGKSVIDVMNKMRFDAMTVGNHEFDFGQSVLKDRISQAIFPILGANVKGMAGLEPYVIKEVDGIKIAVIGVVTEDTPVATHPKNMVGLQILPLVDTVQKYVGELRKEVDIIVVLSHIGLNEDIRLAKSIEGIDVIVGGHTHTKLATYMPVGKTAIVQAWEHGLSLGVVDLTLRDGEIVQVKSRLEEIVPGTMKKSAPVAAIVDKYRKKIDTVLGEKIGEADVDLDGKNVRLGETNLGNLATDVIRQKTGADAALINGGSIRTSISKGKIEVGNIYSTLPFDNYIVAVKMTGRQIRDAVEHGVAGVENKKGAFPQISGFSFTYSRSALKGKRVRDVMIAGNPLEPDKAYTVATQDFLAAGGDGYVSFSEAVKSSKDFSDVGGSMKGENLVYNDAGTYLRDMVVEYIKNLTKSGKKVAPSVEGRIKELP
jgi:2',3'-cyclic-nucleotide 2'-phosphodiesterase (5'-nucleotidase family)